MIGPELSSPEHWKASLTRVIAAIHAQTLGIHVYPLSVCRTPLAATISGLLEPSVADTPDGLGWVIADADGAGIPAIISEANSVSCGGKAGVSDTPAAGVWALRFVLSALKTGFREVRFHFSGDPYDPFVMDGSELLNRPLESAMAALNQWLPVGSTIRSIPVSGAGAGRVVASSFATPAGALMLVLDNEQTTNQTILLKGAAKVSVQELSPLRAGLLPYTLPATHKIVQLTLPANTVAALSWSAAVPASDAWPWNQPSRAGSRGRRPRRTGPGPARRRPRGAPRR